MIKFLFLFYSSFIYGQLLHHQTISAQGTSFKLNSGLMVNQTIGQQSSIGTATNPLVVQQGFQQSFWSMLIDSSSRSNAVQIIAYPNPFLNSISFQFSNSADEKVTVLIFDIHGRIIFHEEIEIVNGSVSIDLSRLSVAEYLVHLTTSNTIHYCKIIKNL